MVDEAGNDEVAALLRSRGRRTSLAIGALIVSVVACSVAYAALKPRTVTIVGPTDALIVVADNDPYQFPERVGMVLHLSPGEYPIKTENPDVRSSLHVPFFATDVVVPAREDHCLIVASAAGSYGFGGETTSQDPFRILERSVPSYSSTALFERLVTDPCSLPNSVDLEESVVVTLAMPCDEAPDDDDDAVFRLTAALLTCGLGDFR